VAAAIAANVALFVLTSASAQTPNEVAIIVPFGAALAARQYSAVRLSAVRLATWLVRHHLDYGLSGYWTSSSVTVDSNGKCQVRALTDHTAQQDGWMSDGRWYDSLKHYADFIVLDSIPGYYNHWEPFALIKKYFGVPAQVYRTGPYTIEVWNRNLLPDIP
jgi:hypothetical protein